MNATDNTLAAVQQPHHTATKALIVDDDPSNCELIKEVLSEVEIDSLALTRSGDALPLLAIEKFDAIFLDVNMPAPNGIELTKQIRSGGINVTTPIMVITGEGERALLSRAFEAGANFFLYKPVHRHDILRLVRATADSIENEKRRFRRVKVSCKAVMRAGNEELKGTTIDLSLGGMLVQAPTVFPVGTLAQVILHLPSGPPVTLAARVLRIAGGDSMGLEFERLSMAQGKALQEFLLPLITTKSA
jgi:CheY-like chemotaxis protein